MKQKDVALILLVIGMTSIVSYFAANKLITSPFKRDYKIEKAQKITQDFPLPSEKYFNGLSINPTQTVKIGEDGNPKPFINQR